MNINQLQQKFILNGILLAPALPFLYLQGQYTRLKVGRLPDAEGDINGEVTGNKEVTNLLAIGESTIAGIGAKNHAEALTGQFAKHLSKETEKTIRWHALGVSGITVLRTINEIVPKIPDTNFDVILIALGGNDVFQLSTPKKWRDGMTKLLNILREKFPNATIYLCNVPMVRDFIALPNPTRYVLSRLAKLQQTNTLDFVKDYENVHYYMPQGKFLAEHYSDGIHPSVRGYDMWAEEMVRYFYRDFSYAESQHR
jgi:lysophospholipase L1-like esterase